MTQIYINQIATAVPPHDIHQRFTNFAPVFLKDERERGLFRRMAHRSQIEHRYSFLSPDPLGNDLDGDKFYRNGDFPDTGERMQFYQKHAFALVKQALDKLQINASITHVIITSCTGFYAPGLDLDIVEHYELKPETERSVIGFMGCYAAFNGLKLAWHIIRSKAEAKVLIVNLELCTLHLQATHKIEELLSYLIFADGCAACILSAESVGIELQSFYCTIIPNSDAHITWAIGSNGFDMVLSGEVPATILAALPFMRAKILSGHQTEDVRHWAIHPGGRSVLDAVQKSFSLADNVMQQSRKILREFGNMSSATVMFVLNEILETAGPPGLGCALAFGPGVTLESLVFQKL